MQSTFNLPGPAFDMNKMATVMPNTILMKKKETDQA